MALEPIVLPSIDRAREWVDLCAEGLGMPMENAASILASLCGFGTWDIMSYAIDSMPPSPPDEELQPDQYQARLKGQVHALVRDHHFDPPFCMMLLALHPPATTAAYKPFTLDDKASFNAHQLQAFQEVAGEFASALDEAFASDSDEEDDEVGEEDDDIEPSRASVAIPLCGYTEPLRWAAILDALDWRFAFDGCITPDLDDPSFVVFDQSHGEVPVYLSAIARPPASSGAGLPDRVQRVQRSLCVGDFVTRRQSTNCSKALLLQRWPVVKQVEGGLYCFIGSLFDASTSEWTDLLFNYECTTFSKLLLLNSKIPDIQVGHSGLIDKEGQFSGFATLCLSGIDIDELTEGSMEIMRTRFPGTNWMAQQAAVE